MNSPDFYELLGVSRDAQPETIKKAYKRMAMKHHPDRCPEPEAEQKFKAIQQAYSILSDPQKRQYYDRFGTASPHEMPGDGADFGDFSSIFNEVFSDFGNPFGRSTSRQRQARGRDLQIKVSLELQDAVDGCKRKAKINSLAPCATCNGSGASPDAKKVTCRNCNGSGQVRHQVSFMALQEACRQCGGSGQITTLPCRDCNGDGRLRSIKTLPINIPAGVNNGDILRLASSGEAGKHAAPAGDLLVKIEVKPHPIFSREGDDLFCQMPITFTVAALGGEAQVPTLTGYKAVNLPKGLQSGKRIKLRGHGVKGLRSGLPGDLYCAVVVETPHDLNKKQIELLQQFDKSLASNPEKHSPARSGWLGKAKQIFKNARQSKKASS